MRIDTCHDGGMFRREPSSRCFPNHWLPPTSEHDASDVSTQGVLVDAALYLSDLERKPEVLDVLGVAD